MMTQTKNFTRIQIDAKGVYIMSHNEEVCIMCNKKLDALEACFCTFETQTLVTKKVKVCPQCCDQIKRFIDFQSFRNA
jgi:hypothetical protein